LADKLIQLASKKAQGDLWGGDNQKAIRLVEKFKWQSRTKLLDDEIDRVVQSKG